MSQGNDDTQTDIDKTFDRLRREPFDIVLDIVAEYCWGEPATEENRNRVLDLWARCHSMPPSDEWITVYRSMGWEWSELIEEANKRRQESTEI